MKKYSPDGECDSSILIAPCFCRCISILRNILKRSTCQRKKKGKTKKEKGKGREEWGRRSKYRWQNRQKFWDVGNFLQPQKLGNDILEVIGVHHLKKKLNVKEKINSSSVILEIIKKIWIL